MRGGKINLGWGGDADGGVGIPGGRFFPMDWQTQLCGDRNFIITTPLIISDIPRMLGASSF